MRRSPLFRALFILAAAMVMVSWVGSVFDTEDEIPGLPDCQPAELLTGQPFEFSPSFSGFYKKPFQSILQESAACYIEMHEKSPPQAHLPF